MSIAMPAKATFVEEFGSNMAEYLENPDSPQFQAAKWMDEVDTRFQFPLAGVDSRAFRQRFALATFYFAMGGNGYWYEDYSFLSSSHECNWKIGSSGVQCDSSRNVIGISIVLNGLRGSLPPEIGLGLESLESIELDGNQISGTIPEEIYRLTNMRSLSMPFNQLYSFQVTSRACLAASPLERARMGLDFLKRQYFVESASGSTKLSRMVLRDAALRATYIGCLFSSYAFVERLALSIVNQQ